MSWVLSGTNGFRLSTRHEGRAVGKHRLAMEAFILVKLPDGHHVDNNVLSMRQESTIPKVPSVAHLIPAVFRQLLSLSS
jgi:hypothetical protein